MISFTDDVIINDVICYHRVIAATPIKTTAVSLPMTNYGSLEVDEQMEDLPEDEGMDDLDLGLEEALQGNFATIATTDEKIDEGIVILQLPCAASQFVQFKNCYS